jgi:hypothetical protein
MKPTPSHIHDKNGILKPNQVIGLLVLANHEC